MFFGRLLVTIWAIVIAQAWAAPPQRTRGGAAQKPILNVGSRNDGIACDPITKYNTKWFEEQMKTQYKKGIVNTALFYSYGMSEYAKKYAKSRDEPLVTIWDLWTCNLYDDRQSPNNPLRCIHANQTHQRTYFENMSRAFANKARNFATVMHSDKNYLDPPRDGIWARIEFSALQQGGEVDAMGRVSESVSKPEIFWARSRVLWAQAKTMVEAVNFFKVSTKSSNFKRSTGDRHIRNKPQSSTSDACSLDSPFERFAHVHW